MIVNRLPAGEVVKCIILDNDGPVRGSFSVKSEGNTERFRRNFSTPVSSGIAPTELNIAYLQFSLYVSDITKFSASGGQFEITSSGNRILMSTTGVPAA